MFGQVLPLNGQVSLGEWAAAGPVVGPLVYQASSCEDVPYKDKKTGEARSFVNLRHCCMLGATPVFLRERVPDAFNAKSWVPQFKTGDRLFVRVTSWVERRGVAELEGVVYRQGVAAGK